MPDPINIQAQVIATQAKSAGLGQLLQSGPKQGQVMANRSGGQTEVMVQGRTYQLQTQGKPLQAGQNIQLRLAGGRIVIEPQQPSAQTNATLSTSEAKSSLSNALSQMGFSGEQAQSIASALVQAGIPLDKQVMQELSQLLPQMQQGQAAALSWLISRGMPISASMVTWMTRLLGQPPRLGEKMNSLMASLRDIGGWLDSESEDIPHQRIGEYQETEGRMRQALQYAAPEKGLPTDDDIEAMLMQLLATPEALLSKNADSDALGPLLLRMLRLLAELEQYAQRPELRALIQQALEQTRSLHEQLTSQALRNQPSEQTLQQPVYYLQAPLDPQSALKRFELRYEPRRDRDKAGRLEIALEMTNLGEVHAGFTWQHPQLQIALVVSSPETETLLNEHIEMLKTELNESGFQVSFIQVRLGEVPESLEPQRECDLPDPTPGFNRMA